MTALNQVSIPIRQNYINICAWNIDRGTTEKYDDIKLKLSSLHVDIMSISESDVPMINGKTNVNVPGYNVITPLHSYKGLARMIVLVKNELHPHVTVLPDLSSKEYPSIWLKVRSQTESNLVIGFHYRLWKDTNSSNSISDQLSRFTIFKEQLQQATLKYSHVVVFGDANIDSNHYDDINYALKPLSDQYRATCASSGLVQLETGNTFCAHRTKADGTAIVSALDHLLTTQPEKCETVSVDSSGRSDHSSIHVKIRFFKLKNKRILQHKPVPSYIFRRNYRKLNQQQFLDHLSLLPWWEIEEEEDVNVAAENFTSFITQALDKYAPIRKVQTNKNKRHRFKISNTTLEKCKVRDKLKKSILRNSDSQLDPSTVAEYRKVRNECTALIRKEKRASYEDLLKADPSTANVWKIVNNVINPCKETNQPTNVTSNDLNEHFINKITKLRSKINPSIQKDPLHPLRKKMKGSKLSFEFKNVSTSEVRKLIKTLKVNTASGHDGIDASILKLSVDIITPTLTVLINRSITSSIFPSSWKLSRTIPIYKKGSKSSVDSFRPISCLSIVAKILELCIKNQIVDFFERNKLFPSGQHGFRKNRSTVSALISAQNIWKKALDKKKFAGALSFDLTSAFDAIDPNILCDKLKIYGFKERSIRWVRDYLSNRRQYVQTGDDVSNIMTIKIGSPQGSCLSAIFFIILIADIDEWTVNSVISGFADDITASTSDVVEATVIDKLKTDATNILSFMASNGLTANPEKTTLMIFRPQCTPSTNAPVNITISDCTITEKETQKLLGITVSNNLKSDQHIQLQKNALNQKLHLVRAVAKVMPKKTSKIVADGIFNSTLQYGICLNHRPRLSNNDPHSKNLSSLQTIQNDMLRSIEGVLRKDKINMKELRNRYSMLSANQMLCRSLACELRKVLKYETIPDVLYELKSKSKSQMSTRAASNDLLRLPKVSKRSSEHFPSHAIRVWNAMPKDLRSLSLSDASFKSGLRKWITKNIPQ